MFSFRFEFVWVDWLLQKEIILRPNSSLLDHLYYHSSWLYSLVHVKYVFCLKSYSNDSLHLLFGTTEIHAFRIRQKLLTLLGRNKPIMLFIFTLKDGIFGTKWHFILLFMGRQPTTLRGERAPFASSFQDVHTWVLRNSRMGNNFHKSSVVARRLAAAHKMPLPSRLGVTTSSFGDALLDILIEIVEKWTGLYT